MVHILASAASAWFIWTLFSACVVNIWNSLPNSVGTGILRNAKSCQGVICGKSNAEHSANYPLSLFRISHSAVEKFRISADGTATVRSHCTTDVQPMHSSINPFTPFAKEQGSFLYNFD